MSRTHFKLRRLVVAGMTLAILTFSLAACAPNVPDEMMTLIKEGRSITIDFAGEEVGLLPSEGKTDHGWIPLEDLETYRDFRTVFDNAMRTIIVREGDEGGKSGSMFVAEDGSRSGNTTFEDAFRNKVFVEDYWGNDNIRMGAIAEAGRAYTDVETSGWKARAAALNAYFNLMNDMDDPYRFKGNLGMSREQFKALVFRSEYGVKDIVIDERYLEATGGKTEYSKFAQGIERYGFLNVKNKGLDTGTVRDTISRVEALYILVNRHFPEQLKAVTQKDEAFEDTKNAGDLALELGFKTKDEDGFFSVKDRWEQFTLAYMLKNADKGMQVELYNAMVVAKQLGLVMGSESRWDEPLLRYEAINLLERVHLAKNDIFGFLTDIEFGQMKVEVVETGDTTETSDGDGEVGEEDGLSYGEDWSEIPAGMVPGDPNKVLASGKRLGEVRQLVNREYNLMLAEGYTSEEAAAFGDEVARRFGTTFAEVRSITDDQMETWRATPIVVEKPVETPVVVERPAERVERPVQRPAAPVAEKERGVPGTFPVTEFDKDGSGIEDWIEEATVDLSTPYPAYIEREIYELLKEGGGLRPAGE